MSLLPGLIALGVILLTSILLVVFSFLGRKNPPSFRQIPAYTRIRQAVSLVVEDGARLHISLGRGNLVSQFGAAALAGLSMLRKLGETTALSDRPTIATSGDGLVTAAAQDTLRSALETVSLEQPFDLNNSRLTGLTPYSYAAGAALVVRDEQVATNVVIGSMGIESLLIVEAADRKGTRIIAASDNLPAQAALYAATSDPIIGEELYAAGAYNQAGGFHPFSLQTQDALRWTMIAAILIGAILKIIGVL